MEEFNKEEKCLRHILDIFSGPVAPPTVHGSGVWFITSPPEGVARYCFHPVCLSVCLSVCVSVCLCVCVCVCVSGRYLVFYFSAIRRDIDLKFIQDTYIVVLNSIKNIDLHMSKVKVTGTVHCFLKVQSYHKNWAIEKFLFFFIDTS